ncbi:hypothetical protein Barb6XT_01639 [Bacteroidales bacterium Barb6XT]|nr:hypothetical protein Barb6XT_01639 [Bacteroidales bacterium Barb6XT]
MNKIEIICTVISAIAVVWGGMWFILKLAFRFGRIAHRMDAIERKLEDSINRFENKIGHLEKNFDRLEKNFNRLENKIGFLENKIGHLENTISRLPCASHSKDLVKIKSILIQKCPTAATILSLKASPRQLNELGLKLFNDIDGNGFLQENKDDLFKFITESKPLTKLDIEQTANDACLSLTTTPAFNKLKDYVYETSPLKTADGEKYDIALSDICFVLSLPLRDMYLQEKGLK